VRPLSEEAVRDQDHAVSRPKERVGDGFQGGVARTCDWEDVGVRRRPEVPQHVVRFGMGLDPGVPVVWEGRFGHLLAHFGRQRNGPGNEEKPRIHGTHAINGPDDTSSCPDTD